MIRPIAILVGLGFSIVVLLAFVTGAYTWATEETQPSAEYEFYLAPHGPEGGFQHDGPLGTWDVAQLQRGYQVYKEVCAACHSLKYVAFRDLAGLGYTEGQIKAEAASYQVPGINPDTGEDTFRPGLPTDYFPSPYPNAVAAAAANNNAVPPDLSLITKARHHGTEYVYSLLTGYGPIPEELKAEFPDFDTPSGLHFNQYFPNLNLAMAPPITADGQVTYAEGNPEPTIRQMSADVAAFLTWTAEPKLVERRQTGWPVLGFLIFATILAFLAKKQVWSSVTPRRERD
ncbi:cytochrome c1 [Pelagerythrobacter marinus]|uniref:cytochrome c1 n=1 Tax=Pelagerythrobacter marinus TaxID=538382 RepID=UPI0020370870|nr:cytochrome c1 [Pelagerythrobacter marinus]USA39074.1 cytochrome c1 [Pelagerythrobacter marinus]WPZ06840.1 cytochrome c1 [Pelagerythrobacter marinus]